MPRHQRRVAVALAVAALASGGAANALSRSLTATSPTGPAGGATVLPDGRLVTPAGSVATVGVFPLGVAVSPDGGLVATINSGQGFGLNTGFNSYCGQGQNDNKPGPCPYMTADQASHVGNPGRPAPDESLSVMNTRTGKVTEVEAVPTGTDPARAGAPGTFNFFYVGVAFSPDGRHLYAAGGGNNSVYDFPVHGATVGPRPARTVVLPDRLANPGPLQPNYPIFGTSAGFTKGMAVTPDGRYLLVTHEFNNTLDIVDTRTYAYTQVPLVPDPFPLGGFYPYGVAVSPDGHTAYVAGQGLGQLAVVALNNGTGAVTGMIPVGDHPTAVAISPDGSQVYVANADDDVLDIVDTATRRVAAGITLHAFTDEQLGSTPNAIAVSPDGQRLYVALAGDDAVAVLGTADDFEHRRTAAPGAPPPAPQDWEVGGLVPTGWYPSAVTVAGDGRTVYVASAKGLGSRGVAPYGRPQDGAAITDTYQYDGNNMPGILQKLAAPSGNALVSGTRSVRADIAFAAAGHDRPAHSPIPLTPGGPTPITHVIEVVRENRTFDQVLGDAGTDEGRTPSQLDADPAYTTFGRSVTPNAHALVGDPLPGHPDPAFATADNFFSDGEASIQGHWWTAAANVNDYVEKSWPQYYSPRNRVQDPESTVSEPHNCTIFQSAAEKQATSGGRFTVRDYGELIGLTNVNVSGVHVPSLGYRGPAQAPNPCSALPDAAVDPQALTDETLDTDNRTTASEFLSDVGLNPDGSATGQPGAFLRNFSYLTLSGDHTGGLSFAETPRSRVAENDAGLGAIVQAVSHSAYWSSTAIFVMEDDSQDGLDHVDGHRNLLYVISPWVKHSGPDHKAGYVSHLHYSQSSVLKTIELISGLPYLSTYDQNAGALYDLFQDKDRPGQLAPADLAPYNLQPLPPFVPEPSSCYTAATPAPSCPAEAKAMSPQQRADLAARSAALDTARLDAASPDLEVIDWELAHPGAPVPAQLAAQQERWAAAHPSGGASSGAGGDG